MTYPPQPGGYDPYGQQQPNYGPQSSGPPYQEPMTSVPSSPAGGYGQPAYPPQPPPGYGMSAPVPEPGERPQKVTVGAMSMVGLAVLWMFSALMGVVFYNQMSSNMEDYCKDLYSDTTYDYSSSCSDSMDTGGFQLFLNFFNFLWLLAFIIVALFALRGFSWARITSFILNGVSLAWNLIVMVCAGIFFAALESVSSSTSSSSSANVDDIIPGWYMPSVLIISILSMAISVVSLIMMANREAGDWFKANTQARAAGVI
ncbi:hypothetical protein [Stackebrandtia nassauensis]|uniref:Uncharacterized protein n=1 Tax=Stackebrandtia nassauensis (strain DSM 44728 / CIP 108903 / NRRL B-16338 / NBRC 102104 / LLR-40K-21) TaxID=446470 RepID=D3Q5H9_STANL|nr:hypothetical protein [Stackebrandtia nassauensis]ADD46039.1 hypothetical protein Snas_6423 [Stackebrandtia nassauensis DSM 44728]